MSDELTWAPAWKIRERIGKGEISPVEVLEHFLARIEVFNPTLKAFAHLDAAGLSGRRATPKPQCADASRLVPCTASRCRSRSISR